MSTKKQWTGKEKLAIVLQGLKGTLSLLPYTQFLLVKLLSDGNRLVIVCSNAAQKSFLSDSVVLQKISAKASELSGIPLIASCQVEGEEKKPVDGFAELVKFGREHPEIAEVT